MTDMLNVRNGIKTPIEKMVTLQMPDAIHSLWKAQQALALHYTNTRLTFTLDGRLVGDIAEALALDYFNLVLPKRRTGGVDALTSTGRTVQVKATGKSTLGPAFTPGRGIADYLLFFRINFEANTATVDYNGPEAPVRALLPKGKWNGTKRLLLIDIQGLAKKVGKRDALAIIKKRAGGCK